MSVTLGKTWQATSGKNAIQPDSADLVPFEDTRSSYNDKINQAWESSQETFRAFHQNEQCVGDPVAIEFTELRDQIKAEHQEASAWYERPIIFGRQLLKYHIAPAWKNQNLGRGVALGKAWQAISRGDANPTYEDLIALGKTPEEIAYGAFTTGGKDLGLASNGLGDQVSIWKQHTGDALYPEDMTPEFVNCMIEHGLHEKGSAARADAEQLTQSCIS